MLSTASKTPAICSSEPLFAHQRKAANFIKATPFCALFAGMGSGKTLATATAVQELTFDFEIFKTLIVAPKRVAQHGWPDEFKKWDHLILDYSVLVGAPAKREQAAQADVAINIINVENLAWLVKYWGDAWPYDMVVIDESSLFKANGTTRFKALRRARKHVSRMVLLSGTPAPNSLLDLWPQFFLLDKGDRLGRTFTSFRDAYFQGDYMGYNWTLLPGSEAKIHEKVGDITLRLATEDYIDLPPLLPVPYPVTLTAVQLREYKKLERDSLLEIADEEIVAFNAGALVNKLLQYTSGAMYVGEDSKRWTPVHNLKLKALQEIADMALGEPILVAYAFKSERERILAQFPDAETIDAPNAIERWNAGEIPMLLAHPASAGHGLNLQHGGRIIVWFGLSWSLELYQQFNARLHRQGQTDTVIVNHIVVPGTVDETVLEVLRHKDRGQTALLNALRDRARALGLV